MQEHLNICPACMQSYKELKGTGRALEAVPAMRAVQGSREFERMVATSAAVELASLVSKLPADKLLRLEARRAARMSVKIVPLQSRRIWSKGLAAAVLLGVAALAFIVLYPRPEVTERAPVAMLGLAVGKVEQFYQRANEPNIAVKDGKLVLPGDAFSTGENGRARFATPDGGALFLGPASKVTFRSGGQFIVILENGELGLQRPKPPDDSDGETKTSSTAMRWEVRSELGRAVFGLDTHAYLRVLKNDTTKEYYGELLVLCGSVDVLDRSGKRLGAVNAGEKSVMSSNSNNLHIETLQEAQTKVPAWRIDVVSEQDLTALLSHPVKLRGRQNGIEIEMLYGRRDQARGSGNWVCDGGGNTISENSEGTLLLPARCRLRHIVPFAAPIAMELHFNHDSIRETNFAFGVLETPDAGVAVDMTRDAVMQVREKGRTTRNVCVPARTQAGSVERLALEIKCDNPCFTALLSSNTGSKTLPLTAQKTELAGDLWVQALSEGVLIDELRISGLLPAEWLRKQLK